MLKVQTRADLRVVASAKPAAPKADPLDAMTQTIASLSAAIAQQAAHHADLMAELSTARQLHMEIMGKMNQPSESTGLLELADALNNKPDTLEATIMRDQSHRMTKVIIKRK